MDTIHALIQTSGGRITKTKKAIINVLSLNPCLLSKQELIKKVHAQNIQPDRSTMYRELEWLTKNNILSKNTIAGVAYYEIAHDHHHHLVCMKCHTIHKVVMGNHLEKKQKQIADQNKFTSINHSLEFFGFCQKCQA